MARKVIYLALNDLVKNILKFSQFLVVFLPMRIVLIVYFIFSIIVDPWIDGQSLDLNSHNETQVSATVTQFNNTLNSEQRLIMKYSHESHHHNNCPQECPEHTCHLGHCGFLVSNGFPNQSFLASKLTIDYKVFIPNPHPNGLKRPPKSTV